MGGLIIEGCATFVEYIGALVFLGEIINRTNVKRIIFMVLPMVLLTVGNNLTDIVSLNAILLYFVYCFVYIFLFFKDIWLEKILLSSIYFFLIIICDYSCAAVSGFIINEPDYMEILAAIGSMERTWFLIFDKCTLLAVSYGMRKFISKFVPLNKLKYVIAVVVIGTVLVYVTYNFSNMLALLGWGVYLLVAIIFMAMFGLYTKWKEAEKSKKIADLKNESYINYYKSLLVLQNEKDRLMHDIKYQYMNVIQMLDEKRYEECRKYLFQVTEVLERQGYIQYSGNSYIDFILNHTEHNAAQKGIRFIIDTDYVGKTTAFEQQDINIIFGNLLDNAVEAVMELQERERWIEVKIAKVHQMIFITISNKSKGKVILRNGRFLTSKKDNIHMHGIGLKNVENVVLKYNGIFEADLTDNIFITKVTLFL